MTSRMLALACLCLAVLGVLLFLLGMATAGLAIAPPASRSVRIPPAEASSPNAAAAPAPAAPRRDPVASGG